MACPPSVEYLILSRTKRGQRKHTRTESQEAGDNIGETSKDGVDVRVGTGGVELDFGRAGGVGLERRRGRWNWRWATENRNELKYKLGSNATCFFPPTRLPDPPRETRPLKEVITSSVKYAEELCLPYERDGLRDIVTSILLEEHGVAGPSGTSKQPAGAASQSMDEWDGDWQVYRGQTVAVIHNPKARIARTLVAFPVGEVGHDLNISPLLPANVLHIDRRNKFRFAPAAKPIECFPTPILQIVSSPVVSTARIDRDATCLVVRVRTVTHMINVIPSYGYLPPSASPPVTSLCTGQLSYEDTENRRHVDVALDPEVWSRVLVVDEGGGVWMWWDEKETKGRTVNKVMNLRKIRDKVTEDRNQFFRVAFGTRPGTALVVSSSEAVVIDIDDPAHPTTSLMSLRGQGRSFVSLEKTALQRNSGHTVLITTHEVIWVNEIGRGVPALSWKHNMGGAAHDLDAALVPSLGKGTSMVIYSGSQQLAMGLSFSNSSPLRLLTQPYALSVPQHLTNIAYLSVDSMRHPTSIIGLAPDSAMWCVSLLPDAQEEDAIDDAQADGAGKAGKQKKWDLKAIWDDDVETLVGKDLQSSGVGADGEVQSGVKWKELNLRWAWLEINKLGEEADREGWFVPNEFERYMREMEATMDHLVTAGDIARDSLDWNLRKRHSHLLSPLPIDPLAVRSTLERFDSLNLSKYLPIATTLLPTNPVLADCTAPLSQGDGPLAATSVFFDLLDIHPNQSNTNSRLDTAQLALDLALSQTVFASDNLLPPLPPQRGRSVQPGNEPAPEPDDLFARAAGQLSLNDKEPPKIELKVLLPKAGELDDLDMGEGAGAQAEDRLQGLTARGLMADWKVGEDPAAWSWSTWRGPEEEELGRSSSLRPKAPGLPTIQSTQPSFSHTLPTPRPTPSATQPQSFSHLVPPTLGVSATPAETPRPRPHQRSSPPPSMPGVADESQGLMWASTQVERGPFGGRLEKKKKTAKKRVGGF
ncbi:hypothetical protein IAT38_007332 [Cryptococcus sp. DSM 104549]